MCLLWTAKKEAGSYTNANTERKKGEGQRKGASVNEARLLEIHVSSLIGIAFQLQIAVCSFRIGKYIQLHQLDAAR